MARGTRVPGRVTMSPAEPWPPRAERPPPPRPAGRSRSHTHEPINLPPDRCRHAGQGGGESGSRASRSSSLAELEGRGGEGRGEGDYRPLFSNPAPDPGRTAAGFPLQESSNLGAPQSQPAARELWGLCPSNTRGEQGRQRGAVAGPPPRTSDGPPMRTRAWPAVGSSVVWGKGRRERKRRAGRGTRLPPGQRGDSQLSTGHICTQSCGHTHPAEARLAAVPGHRRLELSGDCEPPARSAPAARGPACQ